MNLLRSFPEFKETRYIDFYLLIIVYRPRIRRTSEEEREFRERQRVLRNESVRRLKKWCSKVNDPMSNQTPIHNHLYKQSLFLSKLYTITQIVFFLFKMFSNLTMQQRKHFIKILIS